VSRVQRTAQLAAYAVLLVVTSGCGSQGADAGSKPAGTDLDGSWRLTAATHNGAPLLLVDTRPITLDLDGDEAGGIAACNNYLGTVDTATDTGAVTFSGLGGTEMACMPASVMDLEQAYLTALGAVESAARDDDQLILTGTDVELTFATIRPVPRAELEGTRWLLESLIEGDSASSVAEQPATLLLSGDGRLTGSTGCRTLMGGYELSGDQVIVDALESDKRGCPPDLDRQDSHVLTALQDGFGIAVEGDVLTVTGRSGAVLVYRML
jgi:heat shock protein HslJ